MKKVKELQSPSKEEHGFYLNSLIAFPFFVVKFNARETLHNNGDIAMIPMRDN